MTKMLFHASGHDAPVLYEGARGFWAGHGALRCIKGHETLGRGLAAHVLHRFSGGFMAFKLDFEFQSGDGRTKIHAVEWMPDDGEIRAVLQIVHGMVEFIERYDDFASYMADRGFLVVGHDQLGHGKSVTRAENYGYFCEKNGNGVLLADIHALRQMTENEYPGIPYFIMGHSMGSFLVRQYICSCASGLSGAVIMGTGTQPIPLLSFGRGLCKLIAVFRGWHHRSRLIDAMAFGSYNSRFKPARTGREWLTRDERVVDKYVSDKRCSFMFTLNGYYNLFYSIAEASKTKNIERMPKELPVFLVSGGQDPVGGFGKGVDKVRKSFEKAGMQDLTWVIYSDDRHEILNELDRDKVYRDISAWLGIRL